MEKETKNKDILQKNIVVWALALFCCALWGSAFPCIKIGYSLLGIGSGETASQLLFAGTRFTLAGVLVVIFGSIANKKPLLPKKKDFGAIAVLACLQTVIQYIFFYIGLAHTTGVKGSIIGATNVFFALLVAGYIFHQEKVSANKLIGCAIGFAGVVLINMRGLTFDMNFLGDGFIFISSISTAFSAVFIKRFSVKHDPVLLSGWQFFFGGIFLIIVGMVFGGRLNGVTPQASMLILYMAFLSAAAYSIWGILLKHNKVSKVLIFGFTKTVFGVVFSAVLLNEASKAGPVITVVALILVSIGIILTQRGNHLEGYKK